MRISTGQIFQQGLASMLNTQAELSKTQEQLSTGKRILTPSDDPTGSSQIIQFNQAIETISQYQRNTDFAETRLNLEESVLVNAGDILQRVRELAVRANNATLDLNDRNIIAVEVRGLQEDLLQLANTQDANGEYIFAGFQSGTIPFTANGAGVVSYAGDQGQRELQIGSNRKVTINDSGDALFNQVDGLGSVFDVLNDFAIDLEANTPSGTTIGRLDAAFDKLLTVRTSIGARLNSIDNQRNTNDSFSVLLQGNLSAVKDLDYAEAVTRFEQQLVAFQASQQSFIRLEGLSLFNFL